MNDHRHFGFPRVPEADREFLRLAWLVAALMLAVGLAWYAMGSHL
jgi:hypothetical protein